MGKIDLVSLAKQLEETYIDVECSFGTIRVYHVPDAVLLSGTSMFSEPEQPTIAMRTATGIQERPIKKTDPGYDEWWQEVVAIRESQFQLRQARTFVMALRDVDWSEIDFFNPPPGKLAQENYNGNWPQEEMLQKMAWLNFTVLRFREDKNKISEAITSMNEAGEPSPEMVEEVKKNSA